MRANRTYQVKSGKDHYSISSTQYVKNTIKTVEQLLDEYGRTLRDAKNNGKQPLPSNYQPELEQSDELNSEISSCYL